MTLELFLIRHAESETNRNHPDMICGRSSWAELTEDGINQSIALGKRLLSEDLNFDAVYVSPAVRTQQTARYCFETIGDIYQSRKMEPELLELNQGDWEGKNRQEIYSRPSVRKALDTDNWNYIPGDQIKGESQSMVARRMSQWLEKVKGIHGSGKIAAFTHGLTIKYLIAELLDMDRSVAYKTPIGNASFSMIVIEEDSYSCPVINDIGHLTTENL